MTSRSPQSSISPGSEAPRHPISLPNSNMDTKRPHRDRYYEQLATGETPGSMEESLLARVLDLRDGYSQPDPINGFSQHQTDPAALSPFNTTVFVGGLNDSITRELLGVLFGVWGVIETVNILPARRQGAAPCAFVSFVDRKSAEDAIYYMQGFNLFGARLRPAWGTQRLPNTTKCRSSADFDFFKNVQFMSKFLNLDLKQEERLATFVYEAQGGEFERFKECAQCAVMPPAAFSSDGYLGGISPLQTGCPIHSKQRFLSDLPARAPAPLTPPEEEAWLVPSTAHRHSASSSSSSQSTSNYGATAFGNSLGLQTTIHAPSSPGARWGAIGSKSALSR